MSMLGVIVADGRGELRNVLGLRHIALKDVHPRLRCQFSQ